jgi:GNAT superfamily N-acetyltransferase
VIPDTLVAEVMRETCWPWITSAGGPPELRALVVDAANRPVAYVAADRIDHLPEDRLGAHIGEIGGLGVLSHWRGRGIGTALVQWAGLALRATAPVPGVIDAQVEIGSASERIFLKLGFEEFPPPAE